MADIHVNGRHYPLVSIDELTLDEAMVVYDYTKMSLDQIPDLEGFHPGLIAALIHIAVARCEPRETGRQIRTTVGTTPVSSLEECSWTSRLATGTLRRPPGRATVLAAV